MFTSSFIHYKDCLIQQVTRVEWIVDELKEAGVLKNSFYCEYPALGRGSYDEAEWFLWCMVKADIYRYLLAKTPVQCCAGQG